MSEPIVIPEVQIPANASVEQLRGGPVPLWEVEVWGLPPFDQRRTYQIEAKNDNLAAFEGIRRFVEEMQNLVSASGGG